ncbi:MAG: hypothetical protein FJ279_09035 [Planctomycetes bacterium]|nr:hypothetical protein [Deltaproteobacteria bacterium]MBM4045244.1 hypothetical protein [Planctomycetota bacterium]
MAGIPLKCIGGDFVGNGAIHIGVLWSGPKSDKFQGLSFSTPKKEYAPGDLVKLTELQQEQAKSFLGASMAAGVGALLFGGVGLVAGALAGGNKQRTIVAVEFSDGKKAAFSVSPDDKAYMCLKLYALEKGVVQHRF